MRSTDLGSGAKAGVGEGGNGHVARRVFLLLRTTVAAADRVEGQGAADGSRTATDRVDEERAFRRTR